MGKIFIKVNTLGHEDRIRSSCGSSSGNLGDCMAVGICRSLGQILGCFVCLVWKVRVESFTRVKFLDLFHFFRGLEQVPHIFLCNFDDLWCYDR